MEYVFLFYIFLSFVLLSGGAFVLFSSGRALAAILYFIGVLIIEIYFGVQWFRSDGTTTATFGPWPPSVNVCPDFLSLYTDPTTNKSYCVDTVGVSSILKTWTKGTSPLPANSFSLFTDQSGATRTNSLCAEAQRTGVTWEGVWDGTTCIGGSSPFPKKLTS